MLYIFMFAVMKVTQHHNRRCLLRYEFEWKYVRGAQQNRTRLEKVRPNRAVCRLDPF